MLQIHVRRGDALRHGVNGGGGYLGYNLVQLMLVTSPKFVEAALQSQGWENTPIVLFTNEENRTMFDSLKERFQLVTEKDIINLLPQELQSRFVCLYL